MKVKLAGKFNSGFSTLELMIAFALMTLVLVGAVGAFYSAQYWSIVSETSNEALYKAKTKLEDLRSLIKQDFYQVSSIPLTASIDPLDSADASCISGGLCYFVQTTVTDISSCSKFVEARVEWQVQNYPTTNTMLATNLTNSPEIIARGGDCVLNQPTGDWSSAPHFVGSLAFTPGRQFTGIDVLHDNVYITASSSPSFMVYEAPLAVGQSPIFSGNLDITVGGVSVGSNAVDVYDDLSTGRTYAFVAVNSKTSQLAVIDVTDAHNPLLVAQRDLRNVSASSSQPQGWRVFVYGGRLYMTTRETAGNEFHIFNISTPTLPTEIGTGFQLNRTVNDIVVREQKISGVSRRLVFLAADSNLKELGVLDVTGDTVSELTFIDLPGDQDGLSIYALGTNLFFGRASNTSGPEMYVFDISNPSISLPIIGQGKIGASAVGLKVFGAYAYVETNLSGQEFQIWNSNFATWNPASQNAGRFTSFNYANMAPLGFDIDNNWVYGISKSSVSDVLGVLYSP